MYLNLQGQTGVEYYACKRTRLRIRSLESPIIVLWRLSSSSEVDIVSIDVQLSSEFEAISLLPSKLGYGAASSGVGVYGCNQPINGQTGDKTSGFGHQTDERSRVCFKGAFMSATIGRVSSCLETKTGIPLHGNIREENS